MPLSALWNQAIQQAQAIPLPQPVTQYQLPSGVKPSDAGKYDYFHYYLIRAYFLTSLGSNHFESGRLCKYTELATQLAEMGALYPQAVSIRITKNDTPEQFVILGQSIKWQSSAKTHPVKLKPQYKPHIGSKAYAITFY